MCNRQGFQRNNYTLTAYNNGWPFPGRIDMTNPEMLGLRLISALVEQIEGTIELQRGPHPVFTTRFRKKAYAGCMNQS
jgi:hypothetical protein